MKSNVKKLIIGFSWVLLLALPVGAKDFSPLLSPLHLTCGYAVNPLGIDDAQPLLGWRLLSDRRSTLQQAWQILVSTSLEGLAEDKADMWDSGLTTSPQSAGIRYEGKALQSRQRYYWKVRVRTADGILSDWSAPAWFETGLLQPEDWRTGWIEYTAGMLGKVIYFKGNIPLHQAVKQARCYIAGIGFYELYINGRKVGDHVLDPVQSTYNKRVYYVTHDIEPYLSEAENSIVVAVASGWHGTPRLRIQTEITATDGSRKLFTSNDMRAITAGPVVSSSIFDGEYYDARQTIFDLPLPEGRDQRWGGAHSTGEVQGEMNAQVIDPIKVTDSIVPQLIKEPLPEVYVFDAGQNLAGWAALKVRGKAGTAITLRFAENLYDDGSVNQENLMNAKAADTYILNGKGIERWEPAFTYHGFRYVQVEGLSQRPADGDIVVKRVRSSVAQTGKFSCSNPLLNDIHRMVVNTEASNLHGVPTDCPQRDERMGWLNDLTVRIEQAIYNFDMSRFYPKFITDIQDTQDEEGTITCTAPYRFGSRPADPVSASYLLLAYKSYEFYANKQVIESHFEGMKAWTDYLHTRTENGIVNYSYYGDWCPPAAFLTGENDSGVSRDTPGRMISTGYLYYCANLLADMAAVIGKEAEAAHYRALATETGKAFNREYWNEDTGGYASNNQASNAFALYMGLVAEENIPTVVENLVKDVEKHGFHLTTGNLCTKYLLEMLSEYGHAETAYQIATQTTYPGWGFMLSKGATTLWERWEYATGKTMNSHNHPMMGSVDTWFYKYLLGIRSDFNHPGFEQFTIKPVVLQDLTFAEGELNTVKGVIKCAWRKEGKNLLFHVSIPANTRAVIYVPASSEKAVTESGKRIAKIKEIKLLGEEEGYVVCEAGSGDYRFTVKNY
jgi:alpha-L-rhamnosidase